MLQVGDGIAAFLLGETGDLVNGHRMLEQHWDEIFAEHKNKAGEANAPPARRIEEGSVA